MFETMLAFGLCAIATAFIANKLMAFNVFIHRMCTVAAHPTIIKEIDDIELSALIVKAGRLEHSRVRLWIFIALVSTTISALACILPQFDLAMPLAILVINAFLAIATVIRHHFHDYQPYWLVASSEAVGRAVASVMHDKLKGMFNPTDEEPEQG